MTPLIFDIIVIGLLVLSAGLGFLRGFCNEVFTVFGWIGAVIATIYFFPVAKIYGREFIEKEWLADLATASAIFLITLGIFSAVSHFTTRTIHLSKLGIVDRILGFGFGVIRAVILLGMAFQLFAMVFSDKDNRPDFVKESKTLPFLEVSAQWVEAIAPITNTDGATDDASDNTSLEKTPEAVKPVEKIDNVIQSLKSEKESSDAAK